MGNIRLRIFTAILCCLVFGATTGAAQNDWAEGTRLERDGATRDYYNRAAYLKWKNYMGDWRDAEDVAQGKKPYAVADVIDKDTSRFVEWDVTPLAKQWVSGKFLNQGVFLRNVKDGGTIVFRSREYNDKTQWPQLVLSTGGATTVLTPTADTFLEGSTYRSMGARRELRCAGNRNYILLRFDPAELKKRSDFTKAVLRLYTYEQFGKATIGVFRCCQGESPVLTKPRLGLAAKYPNDKGIDKNSTVVLFADFESDEWRSKWSYADGRDRLRPTNRDSQRKFEPLQGKALRVFLAKGATTAMNTLYKFQKQIGAEPEEIYFRYYLRLGSDWNQTVQGGKFPGISGTYGKTGWGGRKSKGLLGWSARGYFTLTIPEDNPLGGLHPIGTYCYHADMKGNYGDTWIWQKGYLGYLKNNQWYCLEQRLKMNTPGKKDGILQAWVDGGLAFEKTDIRFRHVPKLKIEQIWMNVYHGGTIPSPYDQHLFIDNVVVAREYIGPMKSGD